jgi:hypothetical protein
VRAKRHEIGGKRQEVRMKRQEAGNKGKRYLNGK